MPQDRANFPPKSPCRHSNSPGEPGSHTLRGNMIFIEALIVLQIEFVETGWFLLLLFIQQPSFRFSSRSVYHNAFVLALRELHCSLALRGGLVTPRGLLGGIPNNENDVLNVALGYYKNIINLADKKDIRTDSRTAFRENAMGLLSLIQSQTIKTAQLQGRLIELEKSKNTDEIPSLL
ncbi:hypothetical protein CEXT_243521 [Caerostris extrusa]|uniref:Uncharacterized protein n=1 Tax=Caerostris extrusa TaxID=172846 RepID=A0AAV4RUC5_CAEEX|nr:hypothetical protein CEXT_243521 [Caerostris extrusa]